MKTFIFPLLLASVICSCYQPERNCADFRTGTFEFDYVVDGTTKKGTFVRTEEYNVDYFDNKIDTASVRWINECEFVLKKVRPKNKEEEKALHFKILTTDSDTYTFEYSYAVKPRNKKLVKMKGTARKIK